MKVVFQRVLDEIRKNGEAWFLGTFDGCAVLVVGSTSNTVTEEGTTMIAIKLTDDQLRELRSAIDEHIESVTPTDPAPPPGLVPKNFKAN